MNTQIKLTYNGVDYVLEYNRDSVKRLEAAGFKIEEFMDKPMMNLELAFAGAFIKNHPRVSQETLDNIFAGCKDKTKLVATLSKMIDECYDSLLSEGNLEWEVVDLSPVKKSQE